MERVCAADGWGGVVRDCGAMTQSEVDAALVPRGLRFPSLYPSLHTGIAGGGAGPGGEPAHLYRASAPVSGAAPAKAAAKGERAAVAEVATVRTADGGSRRHARTTLCECAVLPGGRGSAEREGGGDVGARSRWN